MAGSMTGDGVRYPGANVLVLSVAVFGLFLFSARVLADGDTFWHIAAGNWILAHGRVPQDDPFAFTTTGLRWLPHEWLAEIFFALAYRAAGWSGVVILSGAAGALAFGLLARAFERWVPPLPAYGLLMLTLMSLMPGLLARPHVLALPVMVGWTIILVRAREDGRAPPMWAAALMTLWANLHGGFMGGLALAGALAVEAVLLAADRWRVARDWSAFVVFSTIAALMTPHGPAGLLFPLRMMALQNKSRIQEWQPPDFQGFEPLEVVLLGVLFVGLTGRVRMPWFRALIFLGLAHSALAHARFQLQLTVFGFLLLAPFLVVATRPAPTRARGREFIVLGVLLVGLAVARLAAPLQRAETDNAPFTALAHVPAGLRAKPVLNEYQLGGFLIFEGVKPFIDSRADLYGDAALGEYGEIAAGKDAAVSRAITRYGITWSIVGAGSPLMAWFDAQPGWRRLYADAYVVVHERK